MTNRFMAIIVAVILATAAMVPTARSDGLQSTPTPTDAIRLSIASAGRRYAGDCASATPDFIGYYCSTFSAQHDLLAAYLVGPTFSEYSLWVFVQQTGNEFLVIGSVPYDESNVIPWP